MNRKASLVISILSVAVVMFFVGYKYREQHPPTIKVASSYPSSQLSKFVDRFAERYAKVESRPQVLVGCMFVENKPDEELRKEVEDILSERYSYLFIVKDGVSLQPEKYETFEEFEFYLDSLDSVSLEELGYDFIIYGNGSEREGGTGYSFFVSSRTRVVWPSPPMI